MCFFYTVGRKWLGKGGCLRKAVAPNSWRQTTLAASQNLSPGSIEYGVAMAMPWWWTGYSPSSNGSQERSGQLVSATEELIRMTWAGFGLVLDRHARRGRQRMLQWSEQKTISIISGKKVEWLSPSIYQLGPMREEHGPINTAVDIQVQNPWELNGLSKRYAALTAIAFLVSS